MDTEIKYIDNLCVKITDGSHFSPEDDEKGAYPMYSVKDMEYNAFSDKDCKHIGQEVFEKLAKGDCRPLKDDVVIAKDGSYLKYVFKIKEDLNACILSSIAILRPNKKVINPDYFVYLMRSSSVKNAMANYVSGSALPRIILSDFKKMKIAICSNIVTQQKIASILSVYDSQIENNRKRIKLLEQMAENLYKEWFVRFRFPGYESAEFEGGVPKGWKSCRLKDYVKLLSGFAFKSEDYNDDAKYGIVTIKNVQNKKFDTSKLDWIDGIPPRMPKHCLLQEGDVLMSLTGNVGRLCIVNQNGLLLNQRVCKLATKYKFFFYTFLNSPEIYSALCNLANGTAQQNLSPIKTEDMKIVFPGGVLVSSFESQVSKIYEMVLSLEKANMHLTTQRDLLLPRLMSGKLEVKA